MLFSDTTFLRHAALMAPMSLGTHIRSLRKAARVPTALSMSLEVPYRVEP